MAKDKTCCVCGRVINDDYVDYKRKKYCYECFESSFDEETVSKHYCYLTFQSIVGRKPNDAEWTQMNKLVKGSTDSDTKWNWSKIEYALHYVYEVEKFEPDDEQGVIGILPFFEAKMMKFINQCDNIEDDIVDFGFGMGELEEVVVRPLKEEVEYKIKSIDSIINWKEDDE